MELNNLTAISPVDGRYRHQVAQLAGYFSEYALMKYRIFVEVKYFFFLGEKEIFKVPDAARSYLENLIHNFTPGYARQIKEIEAVTNHDVKAVEYFLKEGLANAGAGNIKEWIHFGLTSQDINNTAIPLLWKTCIEKEYLPLVNELSNTIHQLAQQWKTIPMLARTHGQAATPTILGKELMVFAERLNNQLALFASIPFAAKFGGATGNFNAHAAAFPHYDWIGFANEFVNDVLRLKRMQFTTQIEHYDSLAAHCDAMKRINNICIDLCRDVWTYISMDYFKQKTKKGEVGSSAMPHKVNPIDFENAEGNFGLSNALLEHFAAKLPISRLQRDLTDSTVLRNLGVPVAHIIIAVKSLKKGLSKLVLNERKLQEDLDNNWAVVAEAIQTVLRRENYPNPYEALKDLTRGNALINKESIVQFIESLSISDKIKTELKALSPGNYVGLSSEY